MSRAKPLIYKAPSLVNMASEGPAALLAGMFGPDGALLPPGASPPAPAGPPGGDVVGQYPVALATKNAKKRIPRQAAPAAPATPRPPVIAPRPSPQIYMPPPRPVPLTEAEADLAAIGDKIASLHDATPEAYLSETNPIAAFILKYRDDPVGFVRTVLKVEPTPQQIEFLEAIARGERRISIRAGHGVGKTTVCSWAAIWHMLTRFPQKTVVTAPTAGQLFDAFFAELKRWVGELPADIRAQFEVMSEKILLKEAPESSFISARTSSADRPEALAGIHSENVLIICDEASAIPEAIYESAKGSMSGHSACTVLIGNPTRNAGLFYLTHNSLAHRWLTLHWSCLNNPMVSADFVQDIIDTYGEDSNQYRVRVLGEFALRDDDVLIPADLVDAAIVRDIAVDLDAMLIYGLDCARFGDDRSVLCRRQGDVVRSFEVWKNLDAMQLVGAVVAQLAEDGVNPDGNARPHEILVDSIGLGGPIADRLRELGFNVRDVNVSESAALNPKAAKLRDDLWLAVRDWLRTRACKLPSNDILRQELVSPTYGFTSNGKLKVEGKDQLKKRLRRSPDLADALCLTFASSASLVGGRGARWVPGKPLKRRIKGVR